MKSMTGYGSSEVLNEKFQLMVEVKSYNNRYLDIANNIPYYLSAFEIEIKDAIKKVAKRGHVEVSVRVRLLKNNVKVIVDQESTKQYTEAFNQIIEASGKSIVPSLSDYLSIDGLLSSVIDSNIEKFREPLFSCLDQALAQFSESKAREGLSTQKDLASSKQKIKESLSVVEAHATELENLVNINLRKRFDEILGDQHYDENRILQEVAVMLVKATINEEIKRLAIHLDEFDKLIEKDEPVGKRMDFLCQEMNREINTIGSKSQIAELNLEVVRMKDNLENIREQVRNVE